MNVKWVKNVSCVFETKYCVLHQSHWFIVGRVSIMQGTWNLQERLFLSSFNQTGFFSPQELEHCFCFCSGDPLRVPGRNRVLTLSSTIDDLKCDRLIMSCSVCLCAALDDIIGRMWGSTKTCLVTWLLWLSSCPHWMFLYRLSWLWLTNMFSCVIMLSLII